MAEPLIRNISDTARWAALYRARETERSDAIFRDPCARRLAGERGEDIANEIQFSTKHSWSWTARTYLFDQFLLDALRDGYDMVINLAAGLDARPYRMDLPARLKWIEVDLPEILAQLHRSLQVVLRVILLQQRGGSFHVGLVHLHPPETDCNYRNNIVYC